MKQLALDFAPPDDRGPRSVPVGTLPQGAECSWGPFRYTVGGRREGGVSITVAEANAEGLRWSHLLCPDMLVEVG